MSATSKWLRDVGSNFGSEGGDAQAFYDVADELELLLDEIARLRLADAERDAIEAAANAYQRRFDDGVGLLNDGPSECGKIAATLRWLLDRTK